MRATAGEVLVEVLVSDRTLAATTQQAGSHGATRLARECYAEFGIAFPELSRWRGG